MVWLQCKDNVVSLKNRFVQVDFDLTTGMWNLKHPKRNDVVLENAFGSISIRDGTQCCTYDEYTRDWTSKDVSDESGQGKQVIFTFNGLSDKPELAIKVNIYQNRPHILFQMIVRNILDEDIEINEVVPLEISSEKKGKFTLGPNTSDWRFYHSDKSRPWLASTRSFSEGKYTNDHIISIHDPVTKRAFTAGFITFHNFETEIDFSYKQELSFLRLKCVFDAPIKEGEELTTEELYVNLHTPALEALSNYGDEVKARMHPPLWPQSPVGWSSWTFFYWDIREDDILDNLEALARNYKKYGVEYIQVDYGWAKAAGDWMPDETKFPRGMKWLVEQIHNRGLKAGIWLAPTMANERSELFWQHPEYFIKDEMNKPKAISTNIGYRQTYYALDIMRQDVQEWFRSLFRRIVVEWGFDYIKIDEWAFDTAARHYKRGKTRIQMLNKAMEVIRKAVGNNICIQVWGIPTCIGYVNSARITADIDSIWSTGRGGGSILHSAPHIASKFYMHRKFWMNDPDSLVVRAPPHSIRRVYPRPQRSELTLNEARVWTTVVALSGGTVFLGDDIWDLTQERADLVKAILPPYGEAAVPIDLFERDRPQIWDLKVRRNFGSWHVVGVFNWSDEEASMVVNFADLGLDGTQSHHVYEFWDNKYMGVYSREVALDKIPPHAVRLLLIKPMKNVPQLVSTNMHYTQGGVDVISTSWNESRNELITTFKRVKDTIGEALIHFPPAYSVVSVECDAKYFEKKQAQHNLLLFKMNFDEITTIKVRFAKTFRNQQ